MALLTIDAYVNPNSTLPDKFLKDVQMKFTTIQDGVEALAKETASHMKDVIDANKKKPTNKKGAENQLENSITAEKISDGDWGVGNTSKMVPYWKLANFGGIPRFGGKYHLVPGWMGAVGEGDFTFRYDKNGTGSTVMALPSGVKGRLPAMNYIEKTKMWLDTVWKVHQNLKFKQGNYTVHTQ